MVVRRSFSAATLTRLREMPACDALGLLATYVKADPTYVPVKADHSRRWHVCTVRGEFELLTTGPKWYDTRARRGGGGAIDRVLSASLYDTGEQRGYPQYLDSKWRIANGAEDFTPGGARAGRSATPLCQLAQYGA